MRERLTIAHVRRGLEIAPGGDLPRPYEGKFAAVAICLRPGEAGLEALFIRRAKHPGDPWSGQMAFPGGRQDPGDPTRLDTAVRETREEVGLRLNAGVQCLGRLDELEAVARGGPVGLRITPYVFLCEAGLNLTQNHEVAGLFWIPLEPLRAGQHDATRPYRVGGLTHHLPAYRVGEEVIWGLTYKMLKDFWGRISGG